MIAAILLGWAGTHLEILGLDDRPERSWGLLLSTAETFALLLVFSARLRGADLSGAEGWSDVLRASPLGAAGLCAAETGAAVGAAWLGALGCTTLLLVFNTHGSPPLLRLLGWGATLLVELALVSAWLALAATWMGRLPGLGLAIAAVTLGRTGMGELATSLCPAPASLPQGLPSLPGLAASVAAVVGLTALTSASPPGMRTFD